MVVAVGGGRFLLGRERWPLPPPDVAFPEQVRFRVHLCEQAFEMCSAANLARARETERVEAALKALPQVASLTYVGDRQAARQYRRIWGTDVGSSWWEPGVRNLGGTFTGTLRRPGDFYAMIRLGERVPGVQGFSREPTGFWTGKADLEVQLCGNESPGPCRERQPRGPATEAEKRAIVDKLRELKGIKAVYLEDREHASRLAKLYVPEQAGSPEAQPASMAESYYLKLDSPTLMTKVRLAINAMPGIQGIYPVL
ncbi:permease-like cell division protein FtsX [Sphaerisporangium aureirubrum]|uniref:Permease-like cell division protein FtsX n=2 Tax=Sphaerisporangium aureirubrum TaxID=1544736 RepID=A0ABW1ND17_9ACTN